MRPTSPAADRCCGGRSGREAGFVLLEVVLALALMGLVAALVLPNALSDRSPQLWQTAGAVGALLKRDRNAAIASRASVRTVFDMREKSVVSGVDGRRIGLNNVRLRAEREGNGRPQRVGELVFNPDGTASGIRLSLWSGDAAVRITVNGLTGAVTMARLR